MTMRCEKHGRLLIGKTGECLGCIEERRAAQTPEEREQSRERMMEVVRVVLPFGVKLKRRMLDLGKKSVRVICPLEHKDGQQHYVWARIVGSRDHIHFGCEDESCSMRMME